jgi:hypothetical protein
MRLVPIVTGWGLFTGPEFSWFYMPEPEKKTTHEEDEERRIAVARQEAQIEAFRKSGGKFTSGAFSGAAGLCNCRCRYPHKQTP